MNFLIYGLKDPNTGEIRYIGRSCSGLKRPREHSCPKNLQSKKTHCVSWIKSLEGKKPIIEVLEYGKDSEHLDILEKSWIKKGRELGWRLTNHTEGGGGTRNYKHTEEAKQKISAAFSGEKHPLWKGGLPKCLDCKKTLGNYDSKRCKSCSQKGELSYNWQGGLPTCQICAKPLKSYSSKSCKKCEGSLRQKPRKCTHCGKKTSETRYKTCKKCKNFRPIEVYSKNGLFLGKWDSAKKCADDLEINYNGIWNVLVNRRQSYRKLIFQYAEKGGAS